MQSAKARIALLCLETTGIVLVDQLIKAAVRSVPEYTRLFRLDGLIEIIRVTNIGGAFSILSNHPGLLLSASVILCGLLAFYLLRFVQSPWEAACAASVAGGGIGNLLDRILWGGVTDYLNLLIINFPVFNFADICIVIGCISWMICILAHKS